MKKDAFLLGSAFVVVDGTAFAFYFRGKPESGTIYHVGTDCLHCFVNNVTDTQFTASRTILGVTVKVDIPFTAIKPVTP